MPNSTSSAVPPIHVWMPNHPQATIARSMAGTFAPRVPKLARQQDGERDAVLRAGVRVEAHRDEHDRVAEQDGDHRLPPVHPRLDQPAGERVGRDDDAHPDPQRRDVPGRPGALAIVVGARSLFQSGLAETSSSSSTKSRFSVLECSLTLVSMYESAAPGAARLLNYSSTNLTVTRALIFIFPGASVPSHEESAAVSTVEKAFEEAFEEKFCKAEARVGTSSSME